MSEEAEVAGDEAWRNRDVKQVSAPPSASLLATSVIYSCPWSTSYSKLQRRVGIESCR